MKNIKFFSLSAALGMFFCSINVHAMEKEEDYRVNVSQKINLYDDHETLERQAWIRDRQKINRGDDWHPTQEDLQDLRKSEYKHVGAELRRKVENKYVFDYWALNQITKNFFPPKTFPKELIFQITDKIVTKTETLLKFLKGDNISEFYQHIKQYGGKSQEIIGEDIVYHYKNHAFTIHQDAREAFESFYSQYISTQETCAESQKPILMNSSGFTLTSSFELIDVDCNKYTYRNIFNLNMSANSYMNGFGFERSNVLPITFIR